MKRETTDFKPFKDLLLKDAEHCAQRDTNTTQLTNKFLWRNSQNKRKSAPNVNNTFHLKGKRYQEGDRR
jgi:hypothetical protein